LGITLGFLVAYLVGLVYVNNSEGWRYMFGLSAAPAAIQLFGMLMLPNTPQYLMQQHKDEEAEAAVKKLRNLSNEVEVRQELTNIRISLEASGSQSCWNLCSNEDNIRSCMLIAAGLVVAQQMTGQPNVLYYAPTIFHQIGFCGPDAATLATVSLGAVKVLKKIFMEMQ
jgi:MFS transporter, SP family, solute carrier family 2 (facilitated glucose transporter), member 12